MDQWQSLVQNPSFMAIVGVVVLLALLYVIRRRRRLSRTRSGADTGGAEGLWRVVDAYRQSHPHFFQILEAFQANHSVDQLCADSEIKEAFERLGKGRSKAADKAGATLGLTSTEPPDKTSEAAMLTILKGIFAREEYARDLPREAHRDLEAFLDSLTD